ncbi:MAG TPA: 3-deoxy-manno-octulosonate cytidylyltransferase [Blastocatellia bacterium]|nr:3-deoxy-manno-octulosonate cytidylyltransferase [Blastocatellia bacterium]
MKGEAVAIIPARYGSTRLPGKALLPLAGIPMIMHVVERASRARNVSRVIVATDDERILETVHKHGGEARMTSTRHTSGTDRVAEVAATLDVEVFVNVQGDEPLIEPSTIDAAIEALLEDDTGLVLVSSTSEPITEVEDVFNPNVVKVVSDQYGFALYFSRSPIPFVRPAEGFTLEEYLRADPALLSNYRKHSGLYAYRAEYLERLTQMQPSSLERAEALEQLRALENGFDIRIVPVEHRSIGVDTEQDYQRAKRLIEENNL